MPSLQRILYKQSYTEYYMNISTYKQGSYGLEASGKPAPPWGCRGSWNLPGKVLEPPRASSARLGSPKTPPNRRGRRGATGSLGLQAMRATPATLGDKRQAVALGKGRPPSGDEAPQTRWQHLATKVAPARRRFPRDTEGG